MPDNSNAQPSATPGEAPAVATPTTPPPSGPPASQTDKDAGAGGKDAVLADLARERDKRQALETTVSQMQQAQKDQMAALAKAFGLDPEKAPEGADALTQQVSTLQEQFAATQREATILKLAAKPGADADGKPLPAIPAEYHHLLTATDPAALTEQAKAVAELVAAKAAQQQTPSFAPSAGQGNNSDGDTSLTAQIAAAEKELQGKQLGTVDHRQAQRRLMSLKTQQLAASRNQ